MEVRGVISRYLSRAASQVATVMADVPAVCRRRCRRLHTEHHPTTTPAAPAPAPAPPSPPAVPATETAQLAPRPRVAIPLRRPELPAATHAAHPRPGGGPSHAAGAWRCRCERRALAVGKMSNFSSRLAADIALFVNYVDAQERAVRGSNSRRSAPACARYRACGRGRRCSSSEASSRASRCPRPTSTSSLGCPWCRRTLPRRPRRSRGPQRHQRDLAAVSQPDPRSTSWVDPRSIKLISRTAIPVMKLKTTRTGEVLRRGINESSVAAQVAPPFPMTGAPFASSSGGGGGGGGGGGSLDGNHAALLLPLPMSPKLSEAHLYRR